MLAEELRLKEGRERKKNWKRWGPYLSERQWGTVREDYSPYGTCWDYFPHDQARSRAYRWGEDGLLGITDRECRLCFSVALWNGKDPILKERLFGLTGPEGNHGEDVKEYYHYIDSTPTHTYMKALYKYPQAEYPYAQLVDRNRQAGKRELEFELQDTGVFEGDRYFDVVAEYAKEGPNDILMKITAYNRGPELAPLHLLPTLWFRNSWIWGCDHEGCEVRPNMNHVQGGRVEMMHPSLGQFYFEANVQDNGDMPVLLFTENETNAKRVFGSENAFQYVKDAFHDYVVQGDVGAVNPKKRGTKMAAHYFFDVPAGGSVSVQCRLFGKDEIPTQVFGVGFDETFQKRKSEADDFYAQRMPEKLSEEERQVMRQAFAGLLWTKQFYHYIVADWLNGDSEQPTPPESRKVGRNNDWQHIYCRDVISMPDKWEYPWFAAWDLAFHMIPFARLDADFAKSQMVLFLREWYQHPNGALPAYEFALSDVNPPVHAWACWRIYKMTEAQGQRDRHFLARTFQKLLLNFTWWVNRKDDEGNHIFAGGFLGLDNIGVFDRSKPLPTGGKLDQADGTAWMAFYCGTMLSIALELAHEDSAYEDIAFKFFRHFIDILDATNGLGGNGLWDEEDGFYYDHLRIDGRLLPLKIRSLVGLVPLIAVEILHEADIEGLPEFSRRVGWFSENRKDLARHVAHLETGGIKGRRLLAIPSQERLARVLKYVLDEDEFLSPYGIRSLSKYHQDHPYIFEADGREYRVPYTPGESDTYVFGGNSNWRGPIWFPLNFLIVEALERYHHFYGDTFQVECPTGSGNMMHLGDVAKEIMFRHTKLFLKDGQGNRPYDGENPVRSQDEGQDLHLFYEYFHADTGRGLGASHQTGWTALVAQFIEKTYREVNEQ